MNWRRLIFFLTTIAVLIALETRAPESVAKDLFGINNSGSFFAGIRDAVPALVIALVMTLTYESARDKYVGTQLEKSVSAITNLVIGSGSTITQLASQLDALSVSQQPAHLIEMALSGTVRPGEQAERLVQLVVPNRPPLHNVSCSLYLSDSADSSFWDVENRYQFEVYDATEVLVALCVGQETTYIVFDRLPMVIHAQHFETIAHAEAAASILTSKAVDVALSHGSGAFEPPLTAWLRRILVSERLPGDKQLSSKNLVLLRVPLDLTAKLVRLTLRTVGALSIESGRCLYQEDRPAFVRRVEFHWAQLSAAPDYRFHASCFLPTTSVINFSEKTRKIEVNIDSWLVAGHGVSLNWVSANNEQLVSQPLS